MKKIFIMLCIFSIISSCSSYNSNKEISPIINKKKTLVYDTTSSVYLYLFKNYEDIEKENYFDEGIFFDLNVEADSCILVSGNHFSYSNNKGYIDNNKDETFNLQPFYMKTQMFDRNGLDTDTLVIEKGINAIKDSKGQHLNMRSDSETE